VGRLQITRNSDEQLADVLAWTTRTVKASSGVGPADADGVHPGSAGLCANPGLLVATVTYSRLSSQEVRDSRRKVMCVGHEAQVAVGKDVQGRVGKQAVHQPGVGDWDQRVVISREDERRLTD